MRQAQPVSARRVTPTPVGPVEPYLCHGLCEIGATLWEPQMAEVKAWLDAHPREVVTFFIEDYVSPADTAAKPACFQMCTRPGTASRGQP